MSDFNDPIKTSYLLFMAPGVDMAKGIALQVLADEVPLIFSPETSGATPTTSIGAMAAAGGSLVKQFSARYIRTADNASPESLSAGVSVVLSYN
ncbi:TPA: hypothetical protein SMR47_000148 [Pseudomonas putida]|nr:hypothetical protein [Pseudomonas putida]